MWNFWYLFNPLGLVNRRGTLLVHSTGISVGTAAVTIALEPFRTLGRQGTILINIQQSIPVGTTETLPLVFSANGATLSPTRCGSEPLTVADLQGAGVYEFYYDRTAGTLQIISGATATQTT